jgi:cell division control protein 7
MFAQASSRNARGQQDQMMAKNPFHIHEDELGVDHLAEHNEAARTERAEDDYDERGHGPDDEDIEREGDDEENDDHDSQDEEDPASESSDEDESIDLTVQQDMDKLQNTFPHFKDDYRLIKRIGEGDYIALPSWLLSDMTFD